MSRTMSRSASLHVIPRSCVIRVDARSITLSAPDKSIGPDGMTAQRTCVLRGLPVCVRMRAGVLTPCPLSKGGEGGET